MNKRTRSSRPDRATPAVPVDLNQRYSIAEALVYLRCSRWRFYKKVAKGEINLLKDGRRSYLAGRELARLAGAPTEQAA